MDDTDAPRAPSATTRAQFIGRGALLLTSVLGGTAAAVAGCGRQASRESGADPMASLREVDPRLVRYHEAGAFDTGMAEARGMACDAEGNVWVVGDTAAACFTAVGEPIRTVALSERPQCVAVGPDGRVWAGLTDRVLQIGKSGPQPAGPVVAERAHLTALAAGKGEVWAADWGNLAVHRLDASGAPVGRICARDPQREYSGIVAPSPHLDVALGPRGHILVSNPGMHRVEEHTAEGTFVGSWGAASSELDGFCGCCNPTDFALLPDGRFVTAEKGIPRVKVYSARGAFESVVAPPADFASSAMGLDLAAGPDGRILVLDIKASRVRVYLPGERPA